MGSWKRYIASFVSLLVIMTMLSFKQKEEIYRVLSNNSLSDIEELINQLEKSNTSTLHKAYIAALTMKKAGVQKASPAVKLKTFKAGATVLEKLIEQEPTNVELRFLRLIIQENAPKILKYHNNLQEDASMIKQQRGKVEKALQNEIDLYAKTSEIL